jgi:hypothetical protein
MVWEFLAVYHGFSVVINCVLPGFLMVWEFLAVYHGFSDQKLLSFASFLSLLISESHQCTNKEILFNNNTSLQSEGRTTLLQ